MFTKSRSQSSYHKTWQLRYRSCNEVHSLAKLKGFPFLWTGITTSNISAEEYPVTLNG